MNKYSNYLFNPHNYQNIETLDEVGYSGLIRGGTFWKDHHDKRTPENFPGIMSKAERIADEAHAKVDPYKSRIRFLDRKLRKMDINDPRYDKISYVKNMNRKKADDIDYSIGKKHGLELHAGEENKPYTPIKGTMACTPAGLNSIHQRNGEHAMRGLDRLYRLYDYKKNLSKIKSYY